MIMNALDPADVEAEEFRYFRKIPVHKLACLPNYIPFLGYDITICIDQVAPPVDLSPPHVHEVRAIEVLLLDCIPCFWVSLQSANHRHKSETLPLVVHEIGEVSVSFQKVLVKNLPAPSVDHIALFIYKVSKTINQSAIKIKLVVTNKVLGHCSCVVEVAQNVTRVEVVFVFFKSERYATELVLL